MHLTSPTTAATCGEVVNAASATSTNDGNPSTGDVTITVNCPDISVDKTADAETVDAADQVGFTITVANAGPGTAYDVVLTDTLPTNDGLDWSIDGGTGAQLCDIATGVLTCNFGDMAAKTSYTVHITSDTDATTCGEIDNTATVTIDNGDGDSADASITVNCPDLGIDIEKGGPDLAHVGDTITYTFDVSLTTPEPLFDVTVTDPNCNEGAPVYVSGDDGDDVLEPGETWSYTCTHLVTDDGPRPAAEHGDGRGHRRRRSDHDRRGLTRGRPDPPGDRDRQDGRPGQRRARRHGHLHLRGDEHGRHHPVRRQRRRRRHRPHRRHRRARPGRVGHADEGLGPPGRARQS